MITSNWQSKMDALIVRWVDALGDTGRRCFDYDKFKALAVDTFKFIYMFSEEETLPKELSRLSFAINQFGYHFRSGISPEYDAAMLVAGEFYTQLNGDWLPAKNNITREYFIVRDKRGRQHMINTRTFDLSSLIK